MIDGLCTLGTWYCATLAKLPPHNLWEVVLMTLSSKKLRVASVSLVCLVDLESGKPGVPCIETRSIGEVGVDFSSRWVHP